MSPSDADFPSDLRALEREYELIRELGQGGMAAVYLARRRDTGRLVAIKAIRARYLDDLDAVLRFAREARTVAGLDHPNIVRTEAIEQIGERAVAIIMEHVPGGTLRDWLREHGSLGAEHAEGILRDLANALGYAHRRGIVHRDVKPENVFLDARNGRALLSDFGIARPIEAEGGITMLGAALGTPQYMSPEQIDGQMVDGRSDIYSLGVLGWEILTGRRPWAGENLYRIIYKQKHENLPRITSLRPRVPANLLFAIERALVKDKKLRWQSTDEFLDQLTYNPPPLLEQTFPPGVLRADDQPTVRFRPLSLVRDDPTLPSDVLPDDPGSRELEVPSEILLKPGPTPSQLPVAQFASADDAFRESEERAVQPATAAANEFVLPPFEPSADASFEFPSRRRQVARVLGLVASLGIAAVTLFVVLGGSANDSPTETARSTDVKSSAGTLASDSPDASPRAVPSEQTNLASPFATKPMTPRDVVVGSSVSTPGSVRDPVRVRRPAPRSTSARGGGSTTAALATHPQPRSSRLSDSSRLTARRPQNPVESASARATPGKDEAAAAVGPVTEPPLQDPFKIPASAPSASSASALGKKGSVPSARCHIATAVDQRACLDAYIAISDAPLTQAFDALVAELRRVAGTPAGAPDPQPVQRVRVEQRVWLSVRNGECPRTAAPGAGLFWAEARSACFAEMATSRAGELRDEVKRLKRK